MSFWIKKHRAAKYSAGILWKILIRVVVMVARNININFQRPLIVINYYFNYVYQHRPSRRRSEKFVNVHLSMFAKWRRYIKD